MVATKRVHLVHSFPFENTSSIHIIIMYDVYTRIMCSNEIKGLYVKYLHESARICRNVYFYVSLNSHIGTIICIDIPYITIRINRFP